MKTLCPQPFSRVRAFYTSDEVMGLHKPKDSGEKRFKSWYDPNFDAGPIISWHPM
ncbi:hypothetical protein [Microvirga sp. KLBC 81]|uniref:hypothetical protein n=1 Tax=Microvirga sp. KLBC 81 TaxID=1862707 RepID=UPI00140261D7|nr:hypothetical protein [Microvirga sp. KLBC 81]